MSRQSKKGPYVYDRLLKKISKLKSGDKTPIKTWARDSMVAPEMVGFVFAIHNGKIFNEVLIKEEKRAQDFANTIMTLAKRAQ